MFCISNASAAPGSNSRANKHQGTLPMPAQRIELHFVMPGPFSARGLHVVSLSAFKAESPSGGWLGSSVFPERMVSFYLLPNQSPTSLSFLTLSPCILWYPPVCLALPSCILAAADQTLLLSPIFLHKVTLFPFLLLDHRIIES